MSEIVQPRRFCGVLCISRSTCTYTYTATAEKQRVSCACMPSAAHVCAADALFLCGSWASCYFLSHALSSSRRTSEMCRHVKI